MKKSIWVAAALAAVAIPVVVLAGPGLPEVPTGLGLPRDVSTTGWKIDRLIDTTLVFMAILFAIMVVWMVWSCIFHGRHHEAISSTGDGKGAVAAKLGVAAVIFFGVDGNLFVNSTMDMHQTFWNFAEVDSRPDVVRIEVDAHQWVWDARYAGKDGVMATADDIVVLNDLRVPIDTPVLFQLGAVDVLHCLYIPNLRVKQDIVPGTLTRAWFQAKETGVFEIGCAQHCGVHHYKMRGTVTVVSKAEYAAWAELASMNALAARDPSDTSAHWGWEWRAP